jgi:serine phosphatase RsbU (regulator of sigma subunit)/pSer/pThr/pTyr-binding forkhead associated (FHA) protein
MNSATQSNANLIVASDGNRRSVPIDRLPFTIGRGADCHLCLAHPQVSRGHAVIERDAEGYVLRDTTSRHGTYVNGMKVTFTRLRSGDRIGLGPDARESEIILFEEPEEQSSTRSLLAQIAQTGTTVGDKSDLETLSLFLKAAQSLNSYGAINDVLRTMLEYTLRITGAERGFVFLGETAEMLRLECWQDKEGHSTTASVPLAYSTGNDSGFNRPTISHSIVRAAAESQQDFIMSDVTPESAVGHESLILHAIRSVVAIPLRGQGSGRLLGLLYLDSHFAAQRFTGTGKQILEAIARQAATLLENLKMMESEREAALLRKELEIAADIQHQIIPQILPEFPGLRLAARTVPCTDVGGDFYDVIPVQNGFVALVGDVCGKGVPAALLASMVQGMLHAQVSLQAGRQDGLKERRGPSLVEIVQSVNRFVCTRAPVEKYVTLVILRYWYPETEGGAARVELINGGHVRPIVVRADGTLETIEGGDMPVGLLEVARFRAIDLTLAAGERIVLLSDGITEAEDPAGTMFGPGEMNGYLGKPEPVAALFDGLRRFCKGSHAQDDQTVLTIDRVA